LVLLFAVLLIFVLSTSVVHFDKQFQEELNLNCQGRETSRKIHVLICAYYFNIAHACLLLFVVCFWFFSL